MLWISENPAVFSGQAEQPRQDKRFILYLSPVANKTVCTCVQINPMGLLLSFSPSRYVRSDLEGMPTGTRHPPELWAPQPRTCPKPPNPAAFAQLLGSEHQPDGAQDKNPHSELITCLSSMQGGNMQDPWTRRPPWILSDVWLPSARNHGRKRLWESCGSCSSPFPEPFY